jgi:hypothetical protein
MDLGGFHYCGVVHWSPEQARQCGWVGPGNNDGTICARGSAGVTLPAPGGCTCQDGADGYVENVE